MKDHLMVFRETEGCRQYNFYDFDSFASWLKRRRKCDAFQVLMFCPPPVQNGCFVFNGDGSLRLAL